MKAITFLLTVAVTVSFTASCGLLGSTASSAAAATETSATSVTSAGSAIGTALSAIFGQYKKSNSIDLGNITNILNIATIANNLGLFKTSLTDTQSTADFTQGLISGSKSLINSANSSAVISGLKTLANTNLKQFTSDTKSVDENSKQATDAVSALTSILSQLK